MMMWRSLKPETAAAVLRHYLEKKPRAKPAAAPSEIKHVRGDRVPSAKDSFKTASKTGG
jgi:hypothetical protein